MSLNRFSDEAALRDVNHVEHKNPWRRAQLVGSLVFFLTLVPVLNVEYSWLPLWVKLILVLFLSIGSSLNIVWRHTVRNKKHQDAQRQRQRDELAAEKEKQLNKMRAKISKNY